MPQLKLTRVGILLLLAIPFILSSCASHQSDLAPPKAFVLKPSATQAVVRFTRDHQKGGNNMNAKLAINNQQVATLTDNSDYEQFIVPGTTVISVSGDSLSNPSETTIETKANTTYSFKIYAPEKHSHGGKLGMLTKLFSSSGSSNSSNDNNGFKISLDSTAEAQPANLP